MIPPLVAITAVPVWVNEVPVMWNSPLLVVPSADVEPLPCTSTLTVTLLPPNDNAPYTCNCADAEPAMLPANVNESCAFTCATEAARVTPPTVKPAVDNTPRNTTPPAARMVAEVDTDTDAATRGKVTRP